MTLRSLRSPEEMPWSVAQTHTNMASVAATHLRDQNFQVYDPRYAERVRGSWREVQLFANYLFVSETSGGERAVNSTRGVLRLLAGTISDSVVEKIRTMENNHGHVVLRKPKPGALVRGQKVLITNLDFHSAVYVGQKSEDRVRVLLSLFGLPREIEVQRGNVVAA